MMQSMSSEDEKRTLWVGDIEQWMDENYLAAMFSQTAQVTEVKMLRDKATGLPHGYAFVQFPTHEIAAHVLQTYNKLPLPGSGRAFRLNWASGSTKRVDSGPEFSVFVGDLSSDVSDDMLARTFAARYSSVRNAKVVTDPATGSSRGYGFVRFGDENDCNRAMTEMQGAYVGSRPIRLATATPKKLEATQATVTPPSINTTLYDPSNLNNTTIFIGNLSPSVTEEELRSIFAPFGELVYVRIPEGKGCGFVQYVHRSCAESAMVSLHGKPIGPQPVRLSWGRSAAAVQPKPKLAVSPQYPAGYENFSGYPPYAPTAYPQYYPQVPVINTFQPLQPQPTPVASQEEADFTQSVQEIVDELNDEFLGDHCMFPFINHQSLRGNIPQEYSIFG